VTVITGRVDGCGVVLSALIDLNLFSGQQESHDIHMTLLT
jgi:hypothetical protein